MCRKACAKFLLVLDGTGVRDGPWMCKTHYIEKMNLEESEGYTTSDCKGILDHEEGLHHYDNRNCANAKICEFTLAIYHSMLHY